MEGEVELSWWLSTLNWADLIEICSLVGDSTVNRIYPG